jgi:hypothetical protein
MVHDLNHVMMIFLYVFMPYLYILSRKHHYYYVVASSTCIDSETIYCMMILLMVPSSIMLGYGTHILDYYVIRLMTMFHKSCT